MAERKDLNVRLPVDEIELIRQKARMRGEQVVDYVRRVLLADVYGKQAAFVEGAQDAFRRDGDWLARIDADRDGLQGAA